MSFKSGFVSIIGRPNAGKSTLLNKILNHKISIVTPKVQTTRNRIEGIYSDDDTQIIFIDTPGIHKPSNKLGEHLNKIAFGSTRDVEATLLMVDVSKEIGMGDGFLIGEIAKIKNPIILVLNKIDLISKNELIEKTLEWNKLFAFADIVPVSSMNGENFKSLMGVIKSYLPSGPLYYPKETISSAPEHFIISELIREKIILLTHEEIPHSVAVIIEAMKKEKKRFYRINAAIIVDKMSKKGIIIGRQGSMIKKIGTLARKDIEEMLGIKVMLELFVRVEENWRNNDRNLKEFGYKDI